MSNNYENKRENLWKEFESYEDDVKIKGKHINYFVKRNNNEASCSGVVMSVPETHYELLCDISKVNTWLKKKVAQRRFWKPYELYTYGALIHYVEQCEKENSKKCLLSKKEFAMLQPKRKKKGG